MTAVVVLRDGYAASAELAAEISEFTKDKIAGFKRPKDVQLIRDDEMPRTATGKILHRELRDRYGHWSTSK